MTQDEHRRISVLLEKMADEDALSAPPAVEAALLAEMRRRRYRRIALWPLLAAAAAMAAVVWLRPAPPAEAPAAERAVASPMVELPVAAEIVLPKPARRRVTLPAKARPEPGFVPVGVWQWVEPMERGTILRVRLPRSAMAEFGVAVNADRWNETVPADVMVAEDGSVRAVRFVSSGVQ
ncbi:MAG: hypothetical protein FJW30_19500 [Acidobacteria bacterium]|nr:hypothetical protein [Acidobacteriota bacterium]